MSAPLKSLVQHNISPSRFSNLYELGYSKPEVYNIVASRRTVNRRIQEDSNLSIEEADRVLRLERIMEMATRIFGNKEKANRWLRKPCRALKNAVPIELMESETGAHFVMEELHAIDFGIYA